MYRIVLIQPYTLLLIGFVIVSIVLLWREGRGRKTRIALVLASVFLAITSCPLVAHLALRSLEGQYAPWREAPGHEDTIVVLAGGVHPIDAPEPHFVTSSSSMARCLHAMWLYREAGGCRIVTSGGTLTPELPVPTEGRAMRDLLVSLGARLQDVRVEEESRNTYENARFTAPLLSGAGAGRVILVTDATHMPRALRCFRAQGIEVVPAPCNYRTTPLRWSIAMLIPQYYALGGFHAAAHEWLGMAWYRLRGWL